METVAHLESGAVEAIVAERTASGVGVNPEAEDALLGSAELSGAGEHSTAIDPHRQVVGVAVFEGESFRSELGGAVERDGCGRRKLLGTLFPLRRRPAGARFWNRRIRRNRPDSFTRNQPFPKRGEGTNGIDARLVLSSVTSPARCAFAIFESRLSGAERLCSTAWRLLVRPSAPIRTLAAGRRRR